MDRAKLIFFINQLMRPLRNRVVGMISRAVLESVDDSTKMQLVKLSILKGVDRSGVEHFQEYGFTSVPLAGAEAVVISPQGNTEHLIALTIGDRRFRLKSLAPGEVALYTDEGDKIHFKRGGKIQIFSDNVEIGKAALEKIVNGETFQTLFNAHTHTGNLGIPTGPPLIPMDATHLSAKVKAAK